MRLEVAYELRQLNSWTEYWNSAALALTTLAGTTEMIAPTTTMMMTLVHCSSSHTRLCCELIRRANLGRSACTCAPVYVCAKLRSLVSVSGVEPTKQTARPVLCEWSSSGRAVGFSELCGARTLTCYERALAHAYLRPRKVAELRHLGQSV